ncbi:MAG: DNA-directed RNA polymerase subunit beta [Spirochaetaceae bacterium]|nr:MAG: DNA-directed RNA polymerase subunit beta [Spirochaetaceae bacterium]
MVPEMIKRIYIGQGSEEAMEMPSLIDIQLSSFERFLQRERLKEGKSVQRQGLEDVFQAIFPIESPNGDMVLEYGGYTLDEEAVVFSEQECKNKGLTYAIPIKAKINLIFLNTGEIRQKEIYMGDIPLMTPRGTFIINGAERVVVSQIHRSPGVIFSHDKGVFSSRIIPYRGSWLEFEIDQKKELIYTKIDRKKKILATIFLRALGFDTREKIIDLFYQTKAVTLSESREDKEKVLGMVFARAVYREEEGQTKKLYRAGDKIHPHDVEELIHSGITKIEVIDFQSEKSLHSPIILNCFEREEVTYSREDPEKDEPTKEEAISRVYGVIKPGEPITLESAEKDLQSMFFTPRRYDLGRVGRYKLNKKFDYEQPFKTHTLIPEDIINTMIFLTQVYIGERYVDDIDHLGNRRIRSAGELLTNHLKVAFTRMERIAKERMSLKEADTIRPQDLISIKPIVATIKEFFGSSQLSQFMDQVNPLAELTHKRRLNALGPGGLSRDRAGFEVRDVHYTHYGRMCPIETPEGPNIGLIVSLANYTRVNEYGFLETPYRKVVNGVVTDEIEFLSAIDEEKYYIAQATSKIDDKGKFQEKLIPARRGGDYTTRKAKDIQFMDVSPKQIISVSTSLIPFLEHDDANRALMGSNMQRQAVPLLRPEPPRVGTGMERKTAFDSGVAVAAMRAGKVEYVTSEKIIVIPDKGKPGELDVYPLIKFQRTNQDTCFSQKPIVAPGQKVKEREVIADGPATYNGELALGVNVLVAFMPWNGYNYEDAILISEKLVREDRYTSIHIKEFAIEVRETKLGPEKITRDIPNASDNSLEHLDEEGIIRIGAEVKSGSILVGKVTPKSETDSTPEFKLLNSIFGEKAKDVRDTSLRVPHGIEGTVIDVQRLKRAEGDELNPGVEEVVKILIATKRKLQEGDKMAGRHGNKGVIARVLPEEDMPFMEDGTPVDLVLNPLGVPSRMNLGQIMETELGWAGVNLGEWYATPVFESASNEMIEEKLKAAGLPTNSKVTLYDGETGEPFENPVTVGFIYMMKLHHLVDDKMHARSTGPYSLVTQQPLGGKAQFGGQRLGEMEVWALEAYGAANTLQELLTIKSDDMSGRAKIYESIVKNESFSQAGIPESFNVLVQELRGLALDVSIYDNKGKQIALTERDEELINRQGSRF